MLIAYDNVHVLLHPRCFEQNGAHFVGGYPFYTKLVAGSHELNEFGYPFI